MKRSSARCVARVGAPIAAETVRQARPHDPQTQAGRARRDRARHQQRTARSAEQRCEIDLTRRRRVPLRRPAHRDDLPLLRRHPNRAPSPISHPPNGEESQKFGQGGARLCPRRVLLCSPPPAWARDAQQPHRRRGRTRGRGAHRTLTSAGADCQFVDVRDGAVSAGEG
jgi:hypothetical protein